MTIYTNTRRVEAWQLPGKPYDESEQAKCGPFTLTWYPVLNAWLRDFELGKEGSYPAHTPGSWLCRDVETGEIWVVSDEDFKAGYQEESEREQIDPWKAIEFAKQIGDNHDAMIFLDDAMHSDMPSIVAVWPDFKAFCEMETAQ